MSDEENGTASGSESTGDSSAYEAGGAGPAQKTARPPTNHPTTLDMVVEAIQALGDPKGASVQAIKQWIPARYPTVDPARLGSLVKKALAKGLETGRLVRPKKSEGMTGATGRFKLGKPPKAEKKPAKKKPTAKPKAKAKKADSDDGSSESSPEENGVYDYPEEESGSDSEEPPPPKKKAASKAKKPAASKKSPKEKAPAKKTKAAAEKTNTKTKAAAKEPKENGTSKPKAKTKAVAAKATKEAKKSPKKAAAKPRGRPKKAADSD